MAKKEIKGQDNHLNRIKWGTNLCFNILFIIMAAICIIPVIFVFMISISSEASIAQYGYRFIPDSFSLDAYKFMWNERAQIFRALFVSVSVTVAGTILGLILTTTMGYVLSRPNYKLKKFFTWVIFIPMIFNGGMVASYVVVANLLGWRNTFLVLTVPLAVSSFNIVITRTFFRTTIPDSIIESAQIDGASQLQTFIRIVLPISKPVLATIGLFLAFGYWNDWFQASLYISDESLVGLQAMLNNILKSIEYFASHPELGVSLTQYKQSMPSETVRMAIAILIVVPIACVYPFFQRYFISGLTVGAVKG